MFAFDAMTSLYDRLVWERDQFPYVSRVLDLPPLVAQAAFDAVRHQRTRSRRFPVWDVAVPVGRLELVGSGWVSPPPRACYWSYRDVPGMIRAASWPVPVAVRLELAPWSSTQTTLGLGVRRLPMLTGDGPYLDVAWQALDQLTRELTSWGLHDVCELERTLRAQSGLETAE